MIVGILKPSPFLPYYHGKPIIFHIQRPIDSPFNKKLDQLCCLLAPQSLGILNCQVERCLSQLIGDVHLQCKRRKLSYLCERSMYAECVIQ